MSDSRTLMIDIDNSILQFFPEDTHNRRHPEFRNRVSRYLNILFDEIGGLVQSSSVSKDEIKIVWKAGEIGPDPLQGIVNMLQHGRYHDSIILLELFLSNDASNADYLYNLGMAYSDLGQLERAIALLTKLAEIEPNHVNGRVALGVAFMRNHQEDNAIRELEQGITYDPNNPWAHRNLGAMYAKSGQLKDAVSHLQKAAELNPIDERAWYGLGQALEEIGQLDEADVAYKKVIELDEFSEVAELAKQARSNLAERAFRSVTPEMERMDAVMYLLGALEKFENMPVDKVKQIGFEIAMLGTKGLDINDPESKYQIRTLTGTYSGLHLVCLEYAAFKQFAPEMDIGFDLSNEYRSAQSLYQRKKDLKE